MTITIRRADLSDAPAIAALQQDTWRETYPGLLPASILNNLELPRLFRTWRAELLRQNDDFDHGVYIAETAEGKSVGYATCGAASSRGQAMFGQGEIHQIYVKSSFQGKGVGRSLVTACARWMLTRGLFSGGLWVVRGNANARGFYRALGGVVVGERRDPMQGWLIPVVAYRWGNLETIADMDTHVPGWH
jgi:ribosomal protein S18 acetylase RimI-like enzyme